VADYTLKDLDDARAELNRWQERWADSTSNNPDKHEGQIREARRRFREIEESLKATGRLPLTDQEQLEARLDRAFPNAKSKEIVEFEGKKYQRIFYPLERSRSRQTVTEWSKEWRAL
jgi:hypothetical protein